MIELKAQRKLEKMQKMVQKQAAEAGKTVIPFNEVEQMEAIREAVTKEIDSKYAAQSLSSTQTHFNDIRNAHKHGLATREIVVEHQEQRAQFFTLEEKKEHPLADLLENLTLEEDPHEVVRVGLEMSLVGKVALHRYLCRKSTAQKLANVDHKHLIASIDFWNDDWGPSKAHLRNAQLWRFAVTAQDVMRDRRYVRATGSIDVMLALLHMAIHCYHILLEVLDPFSNAMQMAAIENSLEIAQMDYDSLETQKKLNANNHTDHLCSKAKDEDIPRYNGLHIYEFGADCAKAEEKKKSTQHRGQLTFKIDSTTAAQESTDSNGIIKTNSAKTRRNPDSAAKLKNSESMKSISSQKKQRAIMPLRKRVLSH